MGLSIKDTHKILAGKMKLNDMLFFKLCSWLGGDNEVSVFIEKLEKAMIPGLREAREDTSSTLRVYGITFADEDPS